jgi:pre-60S factor REI1
LSSRYNLKRRVASLPPLSSDIFAEKVLATQASAAATAARASFEKHCAFCQKTYYSENGYRNHIASQKHKTNVTKRRANPSGGVEAESGSMISSTFSLGDPLISPSATDTDVEKSVEEVVNGLQETSLLESAQSSQTATSAPRTSNSARSEPNDSKNDSHLLSCLFCNYVSPSLGLNLSHMERFHSMFIPEQEYLVDLEGLLQHLRNKVFHLHQCILCGKMRQSAAATQTHMRDMGHCMIAFTTEEEMLDIGSYYDFRSTYPENDDEQMEDRSEDDDSSNNGVKLGARRDVITTVDGVNGDEVAEDDQDGWESGSSLSSVPTDEITSLPIEDHSHRYKSLHRHRHHSHRDPRPHHNLDGWHSHAHSTPHAVYHDDYELHLPSGRVAGHRSLARYYRQNLHNYPTQAERQARLAIEEGNASSSEQTLPHHRGRQIARRSSMGIVGVTDAKKREIKSAEKRDRKRVQRIQARYSWGNEKRANLQKHYRVSATR